jgi:acetyltransferase-like isoleucine patch superfamily enzyme
MSVLKSIVRTLLSLLPTRMRVRLSARRARGRIHIGADTFVHPSVQMLGLNQIVIGRNCVIAQDTWLNVNHRVNTGPAISIGDHCFIGRRNVFSSGLRIDIGPYVLTANDCHFLGSTHFVDDPMRPVLSTGTTATDAIEIGANTFIGAGVRVVGSVTIGHGCVVGASALVTRDVPPFSQVLGSPATVRRRYSFARQAWVPVAEFNVADVSALPSRFDYIQKLNQNPAPQKPLIAAGSDMGNC